MQINSRITKNRKQILLVASLVTILVLGVVFALSSSTEPIESLGFALLATRTPGPTPTPYRPLSTLAPLRNVTPNRTLTAHPLPTATRLPSDTPLPTVPSAYRSGLWAENLAFGPAVPFGRGFNNHYEWMDWSPDGTKLAFNLDEGQAIRNAKGENLWTLTSIAVTDKTGQSASRLATGFAPIWSPDGTHIAYLAYTTGGLALDVLHLRIVDVQTKQVTEVAGLGKGGIWPSLAWVSSFELAFYGDDLRVFDLRTSQSRPLLSASVLGQAQRSTPLRYLTALPAKNLLGVASQSEILVLEWTSGTARLIRRIPEGLSGDGWGFSPDGQLFAYLPQEWDEVKIVGVRSEPPRVIIASWRPESLSWAPDSTSLVFLDRDGGKIVNRDGSGLNSIAGIPNGQGFSPGTAALAWFPDGNQLLVIDGNKELFAIGVTRK